MNYTEKDLLRLARRRNNPRREYLLVNPLQAKHVPSRPDEAMEMMETMGRRLADKYPETRLVIGFAETATAIGAVVAGFFPEECVYLTTTRENIANVQEWVLFREEHSHAAEQKLCGDGLRERLRGTERIIFVEDELSTGRTMGNIVRQMREMFPEMAEKKLTAASLLNRMSEENLARLAALGVQCEWLVKIPERDYTEEVLGFAVREPVDCRGSAMPEGGLESMYLGFDLPNPRTGVPIGRYRRSCEALTDAALAAVRDRLRGDVLVLGTEECMYPALLLARKAGALGTVASVAVHATTRSPMAVSPESPIINGCQVGSFYERDRNTNVYNLRRYDAAVVLTDAGPENPGGPCDLAAACGQWGVKPVFLYGGKHV